MHALILFDPSMRCLFFCGAVTPTLSYGACDCGPLIGMTTMVLLRAAFTQDLMRLQRFVGSLTLGISALIAAIASITVAAISLNQQVHTANMLILCQKMFL